MAGHDRKVRGPPVVVHLVDVAVANAAIENLNPEVARSGIASLDRHGRERCLGRAGAVGRRLLGHGPTKPVLGYVSCVLFMTYNQHGSTFYLRVVVDTVWQVAGNSV